MGFQRYFGVTGARCQIEERPSTEVEDRSSSLSLELLLLALEPFHIRPRGLLRGGMAVGHKRLNRTHELNDEI